MLNNDQMAAADALQKFLDSQDKEFCLTGQAGTGKTYMLYSILAENAVYCATTNKAASVLRNLTGNAETIHSLLNLTVKNDFSSGKTSLIRSPKATPHRGKIIVVDEASMIDKHLYEIIREMCGESKVIYVGDDAQLPPVSTGTFSVFKLGIQTASLSQVMRSLDTPHITDLNTALRAAVFDGINIVISERLPSIERVTAVAAHELVTKLVQEDKWHSCILLSYTNARATAAVSVIRRAANKPPSLIPGDSVIVNSAFKLGQDWIPTDSIVQIEAISPIQGDDNLILAQTDCGEFITYKDNSKLQAAITAAANAKNWNEYFKLKDTFIDLRHAEALTIHKSQGSTFDTVFVDMGSLFTCRNPNERRRLLYVACSRARSKLYLVT